MMQRIQLLLRMTQWTLLRIQVLRQSRESSLLVALLRKKCPMEGESGVHRDADGSGDGVLNISGEGRDP